MNYMTRKNLDEDTLETKRSRYVQKMKDYNNLILNRKVSAGTNKKKSENPFKDLLKEMNDAKDLTPEDKAIAEKNINMESGAPNASQPEEPKADFDVRKIDRMATLIGNDKITSESEPEEEESDGDESLIISGVSTDKSQDSGLEYSFSQKSDQTLKK